MKRSYNFLVVMSFFVWGFSEAATPMAPAKNTNQKSDPFVQQSENSYVNHLQAEMSGDVNRYEKFRTKASVEEMRADLRKKGQDQNGLSALLKSSSQFSTKLNGFVFLSAEGSGAVGRLFYRKDWKNNDQDMVDFLGFVVRLEDSQWKVDCVINGTGTKFGVGAGGKVQERTLGEISNHRCLAIK